MSLAANGQIRIGVEAIHAHVLWVYCAYLLLYELTGESTEGALSRRRKIERSLRSEQLGEILSVNGRFDSASAVRNRCLQAQEKLKAA